MSGLAAGVILLTLIVLAILSPEALSAIVGGIAMIARAVGWVLAYVVLAIVWVVFQVIIAVSKLLEMIFGDLFGPIEQPTMMTQPAVDLETMAPEERAVQQWEYAILLRWVVLVIAIAVVAIILFRVTRKPQVEEDDGVVDEQRDSVFSADLARQQLRDLFRRRQRDRRVPTLDLNRPPASIRETMVYLETLAARQGVGRRDDETSGDFAARLRAAWSGVSASLVDFPRRYERVRYGEQDDSPGTPDFERSAQDWAQIWEARKHVQPPKDDA